MIAPSKTSRRPLKFKTPGELAAELEHLKKTGYTKTGNWNLPQACRHLALVIESNLAPPPSDQPTPEETAMKEKFFSMVLGPQGMPEQMPISNKDLIPPPDCSEAEIERLITAFQTLESIPHKSIKVGRCGPVPLGELTQLHLAHCAHHLSFIIPVTDH